MIIDGKVIIDGKQVAKQTLCGVHAGKHVEAPSPQRGSGRAPPSPELPNTVEHFLHAEHPWGRGSDCKGELVVDHFSGAKGRASPRPAASENTATQRELG